jgi:hypothetical protein
VYCWRTVDTLATHDVSEQAVHGRRLLCRRLLVHHREREFCDCYVPFLHWFTMGQTSGCHVAAWMRGGWWVGGKAKTETHTTSHKTSRWKQEKHVKDQTDDVTSKGNVGTKGKRLQANTRSLLTASSTLKYTYVFPCWFNVIQVRVSSNSICMGYQPLTLLPSDVQLRS